MVRSGAPTGMGTLQNVHVYTRRRETRLVNQAKTSNNSNWLHAVGFVVLAAIVISWALGYNNALLPSNSSPGR